jgi:hypothetical protein
MVALAAMVSDWTLSITRPYGDPAPSKTQKDTILRNKDKTVKTFWKK